MNAIAEPATVIALHGVTKSYCRGDTSSTVLAQIDLEVRRGECVFLLGPSGCGKTTMLSIIGCILRPDAGRVNILGCQVAALGEGELARFRRQHIGFVFQRFHLLRGLTALENVMVPLRLAGATPRAATRRGQELLAAVGLADRMAAPTRRLSGGESQRVAIARALACDPELILADEPTASLDAQSGTRVMELICELAAEYGKTVVVVTHDERIVPFADRICHMDGGRLRESAAAGDLTRGVAACGA